MNKTSCEFCHTTFNNGPGERFIIVTPNNPEDIELCRGCHREWLKNEEIKTANEQKQERITNILDDLEKETMFRLNRAFILFEMTAEELAVIEKFNGLCILGRKG